MSGRKVHRDLPVLRQLLPRFKGLKPGENHTSALVQQLRSVARELRRGEPIAFYSVREVAEFFGVPLATVARVYRRLDQEGYLLRLRGSRTMLQPRRRQPRIPVRGVVGLPIWTPGFQLLPEWRQFFITVEERLRRQHYVADFIFYEDLDEPTLLDRLLAHELDVLLWFTPLAAVRQMMATLADGGVRCISVADRNHAFPGRRYVLSWRRAVVAGLSEWARAGVRPVYLLAQTDTEDPVRDIMKRELRRLGVPWHLQTALSSDTFAAIGRSRRAGVIIDDRLYTSQLLRFDPMRLLDFARDHRLMVTGPLALLPGVAAGVQIDIADIDWDRVAHQVVTDLTTSRQGEPDTPVTFHAAWRPRLAVR